MMVNVGGSAKTATRTSMTTAPLLLCSKSVISVCLNSLVSGDGPDLLLLSAGASAQINASPNVEASVYLKSDVPEFVSDLPTVVWTW